MRMKHSEEVQAVSEGLGFCKSPFERCEADITICSIQEQVNESHFEYFFT